MESGRIIRCLVLFLIPFATGILLNLYLFSSQFRGGFPTPWFFRYATGYGHNTIILFLDWTALATDLLIFSAAGTFCALAYVFVESRKRKLGVCSNSEFL